MDILHNMDQFVQVDHAKCVTASTELCSLLARYTGSEAAATVWSVTALDGVEPWSELDASNSRRTTGQTFRVQRERI